MTIRKIFVGISQKGSLGNLSVKVTRKKSRSSLVNIAAITKIVKNITYVKSSTSLAQVICRSSSIPIQQLTNPQLQASSVLFENFTVGFWNNDICAIYYWRARWQTNRHTSSTKILIFSNMSRSQWKLMRSRWWYESYRPVCVLVAGV